LLRLYRVNGELSRWDEYEANSMLPPEQRRNLERPILTRGGLKELQLMLVDRTGEFEGCSIEVRALYPCWRYC
jgi:hypothetical protein